MISRRNLNGTAQQRNGSASALKDDLHEDNFDEDTDSGAEQEHEMYVRKYKEDLQEQMVKQQQVQQNLKLQQQEEEKKLQLIQEKQRLQQQMKQMQMKK